MDETIELSQEDMEAVSGGGTAEAEAFVRELAAKYGIDLNDPNASGAVYAKMSKREWQRYRELLYDEKL